MCAELDTHNDHYCFGSLKSNLLQLRPLRTRRSFSLSATSSADASLVSLRVRVCVRVYVCLYHKQQSGDCQKDRDECVCVQFGSHCAYCTRMLFVLYLTLSGWVFYVLSVCECVRFV